MNCGNQDKPLLNNLTNIFKLGIISRVSMTNIYFQTHGCSTNFSETEVMQGLLKEAGFEIVTQPEEADIIVINICTVKGEETALREIRKLKENFPGKKIVIAGCISREIIEPIREITEDAPLISTHNIKSIREVIEELINENVIEMLAKENEVKINLPKVRRNSIIGIVPILSGCEHECSYCSVRLIKGRLFSYPMDIIVKDVKNCLKDGCKEIWITSMDNASYMLDKGGRKLPELLNDLININQSFFLRIGMMNPEELRPILKKMIEIYKHQKVFKFLHIPVQSGNNRILKLMNRGYRVEDFKEIVEAFRKEIPHITISTDIIAGFPTETEEEFKDSLELVREIKPGVLNISRFRERPRTRALYMEQLPSGVGKERTRLLTEIFENISRMNNEKWIGWEGTALIDEIGKGETFIGRNICYKPIVIRGNLKLGDFVEVKVTNSAVYNLAADLL